MGKWEGWGNLTPGQFGAILLYWFYTRMILDIIVCLLQAWTDWKTTEIPEGFRRYPMITRGRFLTARTYRIHKALFDVATYTYVLILVEVVYIRNYMLSRMWLISERILERFHVWPEKYDDTEVGITVVYIIVTTLFFNFVDATIKAADTFIVEQIHGHNRHSLFSFIAQEIKLTLVELCIVVPVGTTVVILVKVTPYFYWSFWILAFGLFFFFVIIYPKWIAPLWETFVSLPEGSLRTRIETLAKECRFPLEDVVIHIDSHRTTLSYARYLGALGVQRVVLSDNLIMTYLQQHPQEKEALYSRIPTRVRDQINFNTMPQAEGGCSEEEIEALVLHEIGHWNSNHLWVNVGLAISNLFIFFGCFQVFYRKSVMYEAFNFSKKADPAQSNQIIKKKPILYGLFLMFNHIMDTVNFATDLLLRYVARQCDLSADRFVVEHRHGEQLQTAVLKTSLDDDQIGRYHPIYVWYYLHSPPLNKRLRLIQSHTQKMQ